MADIVIPLGKEIARNSQLHSERAAYSAERSSPDRKGHWMQTGGGHQFWPLDPRPEEVDIRDIARHLAHQCRWSGATRRFYSVAEHCCHVSDICREEGGRIAALYGLLHDASEAYCVDLPKPIKTSGHVGHYDAIEGAIQATILERLGLEIDPAGYIDRLVHDADNAMAWWESTHLLAYPVTTRHKGDYKFPNLNEGHHPDVGWARGFIARFENLMRQPADNFMSQVPYQKIEDKS